MRDVLHSTWRSTAFLEPTPRSTTVIGAPLRDALKEIEKLKKEIKKLKKQRVWAVRSLNLRLKRRRRR